MLRKEYIKMIDNENVDIIQRRKKIEEEMYKHKPQNLFNNLLDLTKTSKNMICLNQVNFQ